MENLWSPAGATGGNRPQVAVPRKRLKRADRQPVATDRNRFGEHGKEGINDSSPLEGSAKATRRRFCVQRNLSRGDFAGMEPFMELPSSVPQRAVGRAPRSAAA